MALTMANVRDWLKTFDLFDYYYAGRIDATKQNAMCVYQLSSGDKVIGLGGANNTGYEVYAFTVLIRGNNNIDTTEQLARSLYDALDTYGRGAFNKTNAYIEMLNNEPINVSEINGSIFEFTIDFRVYY